MAVTQYIGKRYAPIFADEPWDIENEYEELTIVIYQGDSFTSKKPVPSGISLDNSEYWIETGNFNSQVESLRQRVIRLEQRVDELEGNND